MQFVISLEFSIHKFIMLFSSGLAWLHLQCERIAFINEGEAGTEISGYCYLVYVFLPHWQGYTFKLLCLSIFYVVDHICGRMPTEFSKSLYIWSEFPRFWYFKAFLFLIILAFVLLGFYNICRQENSWGCSRRRQSCNEYWNWMERFKGGNREIQGQHGVHQAQNKSGEHWSWWCVFTSSIREGFPVFVAHRTPGILSSLLISDVYQWRILSPVVF